MVKKLISRSAFAALSGVSPAAVTKACNGVLADATEGKRIDQDHASAVDYIQKHASGNASPAATGLDPMYEEAIEICKAAGKCNANVIRKGLKIGNDRAKAILQTMQATGVFIAKKEPPKIPAGALGVKNSSVNGRAAARETKKRESLQNFNNENAIVEIPEDIVEFVDMPLREIIQRFGTDVAFCDWLKATKEIEVINEKRLNNATKQGELVSRDLMKVGVIDPIDEAHRKLLTDGAKTITKRVTAMHSAGRSIEDIENFVKEQIGSFIRPVKAKVARALRSYQ